MFNVFVLSHQRKSGGDKCHPQPGVPIPEFDETFRDLMPLKPLHRSSYFYTRDLVRRQASQYHVCVYFAFAFFFLFCQGETFVGRK